MIQPLIVSRREGEAGAYQLIAGERRLLASRQAGLRQRAGHRQGGEPAGAAGAGAGREPAAQDLGPLEEAAAFRRLGDDFGLTQDAIAARVGRSRPAVANTLRLLTLPDEIQASLARGEISAGHARALLGIDDARNSGASGSAFSRPR